MAPIATNAAVALARASGLDLAPLLASCAKPFLGRDDVAGHIAARGGATAAPAAAPAATGGLFGGGAASAGAATTTPAASGGGLFGAATVRVLFTA